MSCGHTGRFFGASYEDGICIEGYMWDLDSCDEPGGPLFSGGEIPCPACNTFEYLERAKEGAESTSFWSHGVGSHAISGSGVTIWEDAVKRAMAANPDGIDEALAKIGEVHAAYDDPNNSHNSLEQVFLYPTTPNTPGTTQESK